MYAMKELEGPVLSHKMSVGGGLDEGGMQFHSILSAPKVQIERSETRRKGRTSVGSAAKLL